MIFQRSINTEVSAIGVGLHSGQKVRIILKPAKENTGIIFKRTDVKAPTKIKGRSGVLWILSYSLGVQDLLR